MKKQINKLQQGDLILRRLDSMPEGESKITASKYLVLAHGEHGHSHVIEDDKAELIEMGNKILLKLSQQATIKHAEHKPITVEPGIWEIGRVQEYDYFAMMKRQVLD